VRLAAAITAPPVREAPLWHAWKAPGAFRSAFAAAVLLALLTGGTWMAWRDVSQSRPSSPAQYASGGTAGAGQENLDNAEENIRSEISHLEGLVDPALLPTEAKAAYEESGAVIDNAIDAADTVRQTEPSNEFAQQSLFEALRSKLTLLQEMLSLVNEMRKGNPEGAARIVSEMEP
jgi:predicted ribosomally synthesized peptide with SipW-like signal peptide